MKARSRTNRALAKRFGEQIDAALRDYEQRQLTSAEVVERLVEIARRTRDARHRHKHWD